MFDMNKVKINRDFWRGVYVGVIIMAIAHWVDVLSK